MRTLAGPTLAMVVILGLCGCDSADPTTMPTPTATPTPAPTPEPTPTPVPCVPGQDQVFILSSGTDPTAHIAVDDSLRAFVGDELVGQASNCWPDSVPCDASKPIRFRATSGEMLTLEGEDASCGTSCTEDTGQCFHLDAVYLQKEDGTCLRQLVPEVRSYDCALPRLRIFLRETFTLP
jgi:hypothetical protein